MQLGFHGILLVVVVVGQALSIAPALKDASDKKFFASNYPQDTRPVVDKNILNKLKSDKEPYPALQSRANFDKDFIKDSNKDAGHWEAQFEYDALRKKMLKEDADEKAAAAKAAKEGGEASEAQKKADEAAKKADEAKKEKDAAKEGEDAAKKKDEGAAKKDEGTDKATQAEMEEKLKKAEKDYEEQKIAFKKCQEELDVAKTKYEELKAKVAEMQTKSAASTKLWVEQSDAEHKTKLNAKRLAVEAASAKREAAELRFTAADNSKTHFEEILRKETAESQQAQKNLQKVRAGKAQVKADLEKSAQHLQKLRGYAPDAPVKSRAAVPTALLSLMLSMVVFIFF